MGVNEDEDRIEEAVDALKNRKAVEDAFRQVQQYWQDQVNISYHTGNPDFDNLMRWVGFQPFLRRIYGCSFLPHHDYGKGGRGWRDLWQDCLALLMMNPSGVRQMILDNFGGVRMDGTNATIIGAGQGEFIADRNNITRVWMDHGVWPFLTTRLYMDQTGDLDILNQQAPYFKDRQVERGTAVDEAWNEKYGNIQKDIAGERYEGTVLEHLLLQNLCAFYEVGDHNHIRLRGADWNDALDMAEEHGESVAFTCAYAGNLKELARYIRALKEQRGQKNIEILEEIGYLLNTDAYIYDDIAKKQAVLSQYTKECRHEVSGERIRVDAEAAAAKLEEKAEWIMDHVRKTEWVTDGQGNGWFNSYYDNHGNQVEGVRDGGVRMMLTGQVFALMSKTATEEQAAQICRSARKYLYQKEIGGYRINTDFKEEKYDLGRMFGFAYGEKENGAVFSHMTVMYANALYQNGYVREAYEALQTLADTALNFEVSRMYPGIPEYFNSEGRGMYAYLTGAASWYLLTMVTEVFGVKGEAGNLILEPKLVAEQFDAAGIASVELNFAGKRFLVCYHNANHKDYGDYLIRCAILDEIVEHRPQAGRICLESRQIENLSEGIHRIDVELE
jgi:cellobiose phosphorylase